MMELVFTILFIFTYHISAQDIGDSVSKISYQTTSTKAGGGGTDLTITVNWNGTEFSCLTQPDNTAQDYECTPSSSTGTRNPDIEYYFKIEWNGDPLQITSLTVTDNNDISYSIQQFCVGTPMQCTLDTAEGLSSDSMPSCAQWPSKDSYDNIQLGTDTKFHLLYVDIPIFGTRFANTVIEGGVRPPNLLKFGLTTDNGNVGGNVDISIQWDIALYTCDITPNLVQHEFICSVSAPLFCPGRTVDKNWMSIHDDVEELQIQQISFEDETNRKYAFTEFCNEYAAPFYTGSTCLDSTKVVAPIIYVSGSWFKDLVPFFVPGCIYNYPDTTNTEAVEVELGWTPLNRSSTEEFSWNFNDAKYGGPIAPECTETGKPTFDPTVEPTFEPTIEPTVSPTVDPTRDPTINPTRDPTIDPTRAPVIDPIQDPTRDPVTDATDAPTFDLTLDPSHMSTSEPEGLVPQSTITGLDTSVMGNDDDGGDTQSTGNNNNIVYMIISICSCSIICIYLIYKLIKKVQKSNELCPLCPKVNEDEDGELEMEPVMRDNNDAVVDVAGNGLDLNDEGRNEGQVVATANDNLENNEKPDDDNDIIAAVNKTKEPNEDIINAINETAMVNQTSDIN